MLKKKKKTPVKRFKNPATPYNKINDLARVAMINTLDEVGVTMDNFQSVVEDINVDYKSANWPSDCWPYAPQIDRLCVKLNQKYGTSMGCFHIWNIMVCMRKVGVLVTMR